MDEQIINKLFEAILFLETVNQCNAFFLDLCSLDELNTISQRFTIALMLDEGSTYDEIVAKTGASTATISKVNQCLKYGTDGYRFIIDRLKENVDNE